jgi:hypothetical protein
MSNRFHDANAALAYLEGKGIDTAVGRVFLARDVEDAQKLVREDQLKGAVAPKPKTMAQAKRMARADEDLMARFDYNRQENLGEAVPAGPDSSSRT